MKLYVYPQAKKHVHDLDEDYKGVVPFSEQGILKHAQLVGPEEADILYMGQFSDGTPKHELNPRLFEYFKGNESKHLYDFEGDWFNQYLPISFRGSVATINGAIPQYKSLIKMFVRPTFSKLLVNIARNCYEKFELPEKRGFGFVGFPDPHGIRYKVYKAFSSTRLPGDYRFTEKWNGPAKPYSDESKTYVEHMLNSTFSLCSRGCGHDSVRFYESCYYGRIPIIIGDNILPGELDGEDVSFAFRISQYTTEDLIAERLENIFEISEEELKDRSIRAREYFENVIRRYFNDPTADFIRWWKK